MFPAAPAPAATLARYAEVLVRIGLNLAPGQPVLVTDPFESQGVVPEATAMLSAFAAAVRTAGGGPVTVISSAPEQLRAAAANWPDDAFAARIDAQADQMSAAVQAGSALLFLETAHPRLLGGIPPRKTAGLRECCRAGFARVSPRLVAAQTTWCVAALPTAAWAEAVYPEMTPAEGLETLWRVTADACRLTEPEPIGAWQRHLVALEQRRAELQDRRVRFVRLRGPGTDLRVELPRGHRWCTAQLRTPDGRAFVPNLPTEEVFTAPLARSATGTLRVARPVAVDGRIVDGIVLEFRDGEVVAAEASEGAEILERAFEIDDGATRLGEVAWVPASTSLARTGRCFLHPLFDENALPHVALGDSYRFTAPDETAELLNHSALHLDLPIDAEMFFE